MRRYALLATILVALSGAAAVGTTAVPDAGPAGAGSARLGATPPPTVVAFGGNRGWIVGEHDGDHRDRGGRGH